MSRDLRYRCLILDHDDTVIASTADIHYPAYLEIMRRLRPSLRPLTLDGWFLKNFEPGISAYLADELGLDKEELEAEYRIWREFTTRNQASFFGGMTDFLIEYQGSGGKISVISHSEKDLILKDYRFCTGGRVKPDLVFGWEVEEQHRKPDPWPVEQTLERLGVGAKEALIVDDLKPAVLMARATGVDIAAAGWGHNIPQIREFMEANTIAYLRTIDELRELAGT